MMSWTVHEDEYVTGEPNVDEILQRVVATEDDTRPKPVGKYTKSSQVFTSPTPLAPTELSHAAASTMSGPNPWMRAHVSPSHCPPPMAGGIPSYARSQPHASQHVSPSNYMRYQPSQPTGLYDRPHRGVPLEQPAYSTAGGRMGHDARKMPMTMPPEEADMVGLGQYVDWVGPGQKYQPPSPGSVPASFNTVTAESLRGKVYETAKDQHGCRFLQRWLDTNQDLEPVQVIMNEIIPHVAELMTDQYANFLVQKLFDMMSDNVRYNVACVAAPKISKIALTPHGTFSVQKMIETISTREEMEIVREALSRDVVELVKDAHGNHVIQKVLQRFEYEDKQFIYDAVSRDCVAIAKNKQGCCVLQRCLEYASPSQKTALVKQILSCCLQVVQDPFGNYVLQYVLGEHDSSINDTIAVSFLPHLVHLCMNKFSSNVMEKVLRGATAPVQQMYVETMCNPEIASRLIQDDFGNYVLQTALSISSPAQAEKLVAVIRPLMPLIKNAPYAKKLEGRMDAISRKNGNTGYRMPSQYDGMSRGDMGFPKDDRAAGFSGHNPQRLHVGLRPGERYV